MGALGEEQAVLDADGAQPVPSAAAKSAWARLPETIYGYTAGENWVLNGSQGCMAVVDGEMVVVVPGYLTDWIYVDPDYLMYSVAAVWVLTGRFGGSEPVGWSHA